MASKDTQFKDGHSGGPGRPKGARNKFSKSFIEGVAKSWAIHGDQTLEILRETKPEAYVRNAAALVPKDLDVKHYGDLTVNVVQYSDDD